MRKVLIIFVLFSVASCGKKDVAKVEAIDFSLLEKYDWQKVEQKEEALPQEPGTVISYADTTLYSFDGENFVLKSQYTIIQLVLGNGPPSYRLQKLNGTTMGIYQINTSDSSIFMEYETIVGSNPAWGVAGEEATIRTRSKITLLNHQSLKMQTVPYGTTSIPFPDITEDYKAIKK